VAQKWSNISMVCVFWNAHGFVAKYKAIIETEITSVGPYTLDFI